MFFFRSLAENKVQGELVPDFFLCFEKALDKIKASGLELGFAIFR